ncbi:uncharacterized protein LOC117113681 isoform X2 [Anneissia japonica]|uniref:uncharacterized protein LOC117113681 isoform X2 n=1 Tax=Anneissia japonica TaxID=1529436 RepID=UPI0014259D35|nr:uncharacterized protein LOC117113681 isoform X2 [Anneissia japonica]
MLVLKVLLYLSVHIVAVTCVNSVPHDRNSREGECTHNNKNLHSNCTVNFHGYEVKVYTQLFRCSHPTEIMVITQIDGLNVDYARVFANHEERVPVKGYSGVFIHVQMQPILVPDSIQVTVSYYTFDRLETVAYDRNVTLYTELCPPQSKDEEMLSPFAITVIAALAFVIMAGMISFIILYKLHQRRAIQHSKLVSHMESTAMTNPYQVGPSEASLRVEYKITKESQKTIDKDEIIAVRAHGR